MITHVYTLELQIERALTVRKTQPALVKQVKHLCILQFIRIYIAVNTNESDAGSIIKGLYILRMNDDGTCS